MSDRETSELAQELNFNAMLILSFLEKSDSLSPEDKQQYRSMMTREDAASASFFLLSVVMQTYAMETGRTKEETAEHLRGLLLKMSRD